VHVLYHHSCLGAGDAEHASMVVHSVECVCRMNKAGWLPMLMAGNMTGTAMESTVDSQQHQTNCVTRCSYELLTLTPDAALITSDAASRLATTSPASLL
jgi:hypothetical protein